jgi:hypothetical protein
MTNSFTTTVELCVNGNSCEREVTVHYEYEPAGGDGWHEPRYSERATLCSVEVGKFDLMPLLTKECISALEADCCANEEAEREFRESEAADMRSEAQWEVM